MSDGRTEIRKLLNVLDGGKGTKVLKEHGYPDVDDPDTGNETKVEVEFKDGDQVEVEVYAQGMDQLKRLMDLAGIFHNDKQNGALSSPDPMGQPPMDPGLGAPDVADPGLGAPDVDVGVDANMDTTPADNSTATIGTPEIPGTDVPADPAADMSLNGPGADDEAPEVDFDMGMESEENDDESLEETRGGRWDYGHPNPNLGQEPYEPEASNYSGLAGKPNRYVQAKHGDNAMVDASKPKKGEVAVDSLEEVDTLKKGLAEYLEEISLEKKDLDEVNPDKVGELVAKTTPNTLSAPKLRAISKSAENLERDVSSGQRQVDDLDAGQVMDLIVGDDEVEATGFADPDKRKVHDLADQFGDEFEEGKRQYSFKQQNLPFQGLTGVQRVRRNALRAARRGLKK